ncbi:putative acetyl-CoA synthetase-like protein [Lyophyllum shimeji]|uniref:Acetyl-CoA synthetase-like protein n=1 Tax=Lyophyllum shimeji TaxID=47721 RepID=A0A9P3PKU9_LYOSH|nr:putative acetyl-CoA synthetase-like protein [Lyophyllum shimeji]
MNRILHCRSIGQGADGTGHICVRDEEGFFWTVDRSKELIKYKVCIDPPPLYELWSVSKAFVWCGDSKLESVLLTHPEIADARVVGVEDPIEATELPRNVVV